MKINNKFDGLYESYKEGVYAFILSRTKNKDDSWDIFQDVFTKVFEKISVLDEEKNIKSYIFTLTYNKIADYFRKNNSNIELDENLEYQKNSFQDSSLLKLDITEGLERLLKGKKKFLN